MLAAFERVSGGELPRLLPLRKAFKALQEKDGFEFTDTDKQELEQQFPLETGQFLVDRDGIVWWVNLELAREGYAAIGKFPTDEELLQVVQAYGG
jgi:hypothetical protein